MGFDVAIVGGGPSGSACALALRAFAPSLSIALLESSSYDRPRLGETLSPAARPLLEHLGVYDAFLGDAHRITFGTAAAWGDASLAENEFLFHARGAGWHLDRAVFDATLAREAQARGATLIHGTGVPPARFVVDATGNASFATRAHGAAFVTVDHLAGFGRFFDDGGTSDPRTIVEAFADGWWYTASLPGGRRFVACMTDADIARDLRIADAGVWNGIAATMPIIGPIVAAASRPGPIIARAAESRALSPAAGSGWIAVGDSASRFDPLSSQGIVKALRSGTFAAYAIGDLLTRDDDRGMRRYPRFIRAEFDAYLASRSRFYGEERRWRERPFWSRRRE